MICVRAGWTVDGGSDPGMGMTELAWRILGILRAHAVCYGAAAALYVASKERASPATGAEQWLGERSAVHGTFAFIMRWRVEEIAVPEEGE